jgi:hypothetical protein
MQMHVERELTGFEFIGEEEIFDFFEIQIVVIGDLDEFECLKNTQVKLLFN